MLAIGGGIFIHCGPLLSLFRNSLNHTWGTRQQTGDSLWNLGSGLHTATEQQRTYVNIELLVVPLESACTLVRQVTAALKSALYKRFVNLPSGEHLQGTMDGFTKWGCPVCASMAPTFPSSPSTITNLWKSYGVALYCSPSCRWPQMPIRVTTFASNICL